MGKVQRSFSEPDRIDLDWDQKWKGEDNGLITCWEVGRQMRQSKPDLARQTEMGELPILGWKGGVDPEAKMQKKKTGSLYYLALWQGLSGQNLNIDIEAGAVLTCTRTNVMVTYKMVS